MVALRQEASDERSLGGWLRSTAQQTGLCTVTVQVDPANFEATAVLEQLEDRGRAVPVLFESTRALSGEPSEFALLMNAYAQFPAVAAALSLDVKTWPELLEGYVHRVRNLIPPAVSDVAPVQEHVLRGADVDLRMLPWVRHVAMQGGPYFSPIVVARRPGGGRYNLSWNRAMYLDPTHIGVHISPKDLWGFHRMAEEDGQPLPVALVLGHHPAFNLAGAAIGTVDTDEYDIAGALLGAPVRVAPSCSFGPDLLIPADAEIIVEGRLLPGVRAVEGPFGEYMRYVGPQKLSHLMEVTAVTWRAGAIALEIFTCHADHLNAHISIEASLLERTRSTVPQVTGVSWFRGGGPTTLVISMKKTAEGQPMRAAMAAMSAQNILKQIIVVDDDINIENSHDVLWAVSTRTRAAEDINILTNLQGITLDPSGSGYAKTSGFIIDATWPLDRPHPATGRVPDELLARYPLENYLD